MWLVTPHLQSSSDSMIRLPERTSDIGSQFERRRDVRVQGAARMVFFLKYVLSRYEVNSIVYHVRIYLRLGERKG